MNLQFSQDYKEIDETMDAEKVNKLVNVWTLVLAVVLIIPYWRIWGIGEYEISLMFKVIISYFIFILVHELLHLIGYIFVGKASIDQVKLGIIWKYLMPYAHCKVPMKITHYKISVLLPFILGIVPIIFAFLYGNGFWFIIGFLMTVGSLGDFIIIWILRKYPREVYIQDHPSKIGCIVYTPH
ncbi:DUF3267 domain-containing protein [Texcoconibacillus texcoconensis]|uniref:Zincin peptidase n=1 Tax=Texcoconibacillus texcoconensis TaxID=1095777 RepID=A0A840QIN9_9BACI|nr:DUF3267 domain-containing protein [Texcoconibacillus texcoconensis]MBB5171945.1 hypothetical protein [Texcoconibacillus texcoconensis]